MNPTSDRPVENRPGAQRPLADQASTRRVQALDAAPQNADASPPKLTQSVDAQARRLARDLMRSARDAALAVLAPHSGYPSASRVLTATDFEGRPILLLSGLSLHARALGADKRCSLLVGRSGKGDPLAHPRMTIFADAHRIRPDDPIRAELRDRMLARHPKAELYVDFPDFFFVRLEPTGASLNAGFAKAFDLSPNDFIDEASPALQATVSRARDHMNADHGDFVDKIASSSRRREGTGWRIATMDRLGFEIIRGDDILRTEFIRPADIDAGGYRDAFVALANGISKD